MMRLDLTFPLIRPIPQYLSGYTMNILDSVTDAGLDANCGLDACDFQIKLENSPACKCGSGHEIVLHVLLRQVC